MHNQTEILEAYLDIVRQSPVNDLQNCALNGFIQEILNLLNTNYHEPASCLKTLRKCLDLLKSKVKLTAIR